MCKFNRLLIILLFFSVACGKKSGKGHNEKFSMDKGAELYAKYGCAVCHSLDGKEIYGPPLNGIYMKELKVIRKGKEFTVTADRNYLKRAILDPRYEKVLEYSNKEMPLTQISGEDVEILVDYIIALDNKTIQEK